MPLATDAPQRHGEHDGARRRAITRPRGIRRQAAEGATQAGLKLSPRFYNEGFRNADNVLAAMYRGVTGAGHRHRGQSAADEPRRRRVALCPQRGERSARRWRAPTVEDRNLNDISLDRARHEGVSCSSSAPATSNNPYIDQTAAPGQPQTVVFTIDLPTR